MALKDYDTEEIIRELLSRFRYNVTDIIQTIKDIYDEELENE